MQGESSGTGKLCTSKVTLSGTLSFGVNKYKMIDFIISYDEDDSNGEKEMKNIKFDGTLLCNDEEVDLSTLSIDDPLISLIVCPDEEGRNVFISDLPTSTTASYLAYDSSAVKGEYSSCKKPVPIRCGFCAIFRFCRFRLSAVQIALTSISSHGIICRNAALFQSAAASCRIPAGRFFWTF